MQKKPARLTNEGGVHPQDREITLKYSTSDSVQWQGALIDNYVLFEHWPFKKGTWTYEITISIAALPARKLHALLVPAHGLSDEMFIEMNSGINIYAVWPASFITAVPHVEQTGPEVIGE